MDFTRWPGLRLGRLSLRTLIGGVLGLFVFTLTAFLAGLIGQSSINQLRDRVGQSLATDADRMAERLNSEMFSRARELALLEALDPLRGDPQAPAQLAFMQLLLDGLKQSFPFYTRLTHRPGDCRDGLFAACCFSRPHAGRP